MLQKNRSDKGDKTEFSLDDFSYKNEHEKNADAFIRDAQELAKRFNVTIETQNYTEEATLEEIDPFPPTDAQIRIMLREMNPNLPKNVEITNDIRKRFIDGHAAYLQEAHDAEIRSADETVIAITVSTKPRRQVKVQDEEEARVLIHQVIIALQWIALEHCGQYFLYLKTEDDDTEYYQVNDRLPQIMVEEYKRFYYGYVNDEEMVFVF